MAGIKGQISGQLSGQVSRQVSGQVSGQVSEKISSQTFEAIIKVESGGNIHAIGDYGQAIGPLQIRRVYWEDAAKNDSSLKDGGKTYQNCKGKGSVEYSKKVMESYMDCYATVEKLGHNPTDQDIVRIHKGGPDGHKEVNTISFWDKVREAF